MKLVPYPRIAYARVSNRHKKIRVPRIPGVRSVNIVEPTGYRVTTESSYSDTGSSGGTHSSSGFRVIGTSFRNGSQNPHWKDQCRLGANATTPLSFADYSGEFDRSFWTAYSIGVSRRQSNNSVSRVWSYGVSSFLDYGLPNTNSAPTSVITDVHNHCIRKFIDAVSAAQSSENLTGRSIKHFKHDVHSTLHPMAGIQSKISSYLTSLEKVSYGKLKGPSLYSTITQAYLEFKFGVEPFVNDISDIVSDMVIRDRKRNPSEPVTARSHQIYHGQTFRGAYTGDSGFMVAFSPFWNGKVTSTYSEQMRGACRTGINDDGKLGLVQDNKLLPKDWAPTAFSILPYAWMVNYFTNIRDIIDAASLRYSDLVWACSSTRDITVTDIGNIFLNSPNLDAGVFGVYTNYATESFGGNATFSVKTGNRFILSPAQLVPSFVFTIPTSSTPWVNMMAAFSPKIFKIVGNLFS